MLDALSVFLSVPLPKKSNELEDNPQVSVSVFNPFTASLSYDQQSNHGRTGCYRAQEAKPILGPALFIYKLYLKNYASNTL